MLNQKARNVTMKKSNCSSFIYKAKLLTVVATTLSASLVPGLFLKANAAAIITAGQVQIGVDDLGQLNPVSPLGVPDPTWGQTIVGLRYTTTGNEGTSHGCLCEGWGTGANGKTLGYANNAVGTAGLTLSSFTSTASTAVSVVETTLNGGGLLVTHDFRASSSENLYAVEVTLKNTTSDTLNNVLYRRLFDFDLGLRADGTQFNEFITIGNGGTVPTSLVRTSNDGFVSADPLTSIGGLPAAGYPPAGSQPFFFDNVGPTDQGAAFDFDFGSLNAGDSQKFTIFYGAASNRADALGALGKVGAELYALGRPGSSPITGEPNNFIFGFKGVGGTSLPDPDPAPATTPEPGSIAFLGMTVLYMARYASRRQKQS